MKRESCLTRFPHIQSLEMEAQLSIQCARCDIVRTAEGREEVVQRVFVGDVYGCLLRVAVLVKQWFSERGLKSFPKVSGSKGIQVYVPLNTPTSYAITQPHARRVAENLEHIGESLSASRLPDCVLDAELVALAYGERPSFQLLQQSRRNDAPVVIYAFDLLNYRGRDLKKVPMWQCRSALEAIAAHFPEHVRLSELLLAETQMTRLVEALEQHRVEGIVVKRKQSMYLEEKEPGSWVKFRLYEIDEFVIGGSLEA